MANFDKNFTKLEPNQAILQLVSFDQVISILKSFALEVKNNPIFGIYFESASAHWYSFTYMAKNFTRKTLNDRRNEKNNAYFEYRPDVNG